MLRRTGDDERSRPRGDIAPRLDMEGLPVLVRWNSRSMRWNARCKGEWLLSSATVANRRTSSFHVAGLAGQALRAHRLGRDEYIVCCGKRC